MGRITRWLGLDAAATSHELTAGRSHTFDAAESVPRPVDVLLAAMAGATGGKVSRADALSVPAVLRARNLLCSTATLPLVQRSSDRRLVRSPLLEQIDLDVPNVVTLATTVEDLVLDGIGWWRITGSDAAGYPTQARRLDPALVSTQPPAGRSQSRLPGGTDPRGALVWIDGVETPADQVIRFDSPNPAVLVAGARAIRRALMLDRLAALYADGGRPLDYFTPAEAADELEDDEVREFLGDWHTARKARSTAYIPSSVNYHSIDVMSPADLQLAELTKTAGLQIANAFGLDPEDLGISTTSRTYSNAVDRRRDRINDVLSPYMRAVTDRLSMGDVTRRGHRVEFDLDDYLRADPKTRWETYKMAIDLGVMSREEVRAEEGLPAGAPALPAAPGAPAAPVTPLRIAAGFDSDTAAHTFTFADSAQHEFAADAESRVITGLAVPWGAVARKNGHRFRFHRGALQYGALSRVKHYQDHKHAVGKALELTETDAGLVARLSVSKGARGDDLLQLAVDEVYDGLSIGVDFSLDPSVGDARLAADGVYDVFRADLREITTTAMPAFDDSRITRVAASRDTERDTMTGTDPAATATAEPATTTTAAFSMDAFAQAMAAAMTPPAVETRPTVDPTRAMTQVADPEPYRLDASGNLRPGSHDFSQDLVRASQGDDAAMQRATQFVTAAFDVDRADVTALNPTRQRPDMYVDQKDFTSPVWETINKGTLPDSTPFTFPKFNTASGLVAAHTEGVEPTPGTFTATSQTVTPGAISGKVEITRETWDAGGNPQVSNLIWNQMRRAWYEGLEARAIAVLDAATPAAVALTAGGGTTGQTLDAEITAAFASLQFVRGGFRMTDMFTQVDLFKALVAAKDTAGRRLYPALGPANASGTVRQRFSAIDINGVAALPAWALAASGSVVASSYLFDRNDVHGWATAPQRLEFQYRVAYVDLAIWGYAATAISDINGVREITYDPVA